MKTSVINHPTREPLIVIHRWQLDACDGNACAAALLSHLEYWHGIKLEQSLKARQANEVSESHNDKPIQDESLWQFHSLGELERGLLIYGRTTISAGIKKLVDKGFIRTSRNPNPRYKFDKTTFFLYLPQQVNQWLAEHHTREYPRAENGSPLTRNGSRWSETGPPSTENGQAIPETSSEVSTETTSEEIVNRFSSEVKNTSDKERNADRASRLSMKEKREKSFKAAKAPPTEWATRLANLLRSCIIQNNPTARVTDDHALKWAHVADLMIRIDHRTFEQIHELILWSQRDVFWRSIILSMRKLREKFDQLTLKKIEVPRNGNGNRAQERQAANLDALARAKGNLHRVDNGANYPPGRDF